MLTQPRHLSIRRSGGGFALLEALIALLLFSIGVLGLVGLQAQMSRAQTAANFRGVASFLATELVGVMWGDRANLAKYSGASCKGYSRCNEWQEKVARTLPGGSATITTAAGGLRITLTWQQPNGGTHTHTAEAQVTF